jgi:hypothetical protein
VSTPEERVCDSRLITRLFLRRRAALLTGHQHERVDSSCAAASNRSSGTWL